MNTDADETAAPVLVAPPAAPPADCPGVGGVVGCDDARSGVVEAEERRRPPRLRSRCLCVPVKEDGSVSLCRAERMHIHRTMDVGSGFMLVRAHIYIYVGWIQAAGIAWSSRSSP